MNGETLITGVDLSRRVLFSGLRNSGVKTKTVRISGHFLAPRAAGSAQDLILQLLKENTSDTSTWSEPWERLK